MRFAINIPNFGHFGDPKTVAMVASAAEEAGFGAGFGGPIEDEYASFGEPTDPVVLAERLDEGLDLLQRYWSGGPVNRTRATREHERRRVRRLGDVRFVEGEPGRRISCERSCRHHALFAELDAAVRKAACRRLLI
jgi:hypothetical protein